MTEPSARIIADSIATGGARLTTMEVVMHRFVLAEFNTHRQFSRNSASSRAIPVKKQVERVMNDPALPLHWGANQPGMQADDEIPATERERAAWSWLTARDEAVSTVQRLDGLGLHKQVANRLLEPFMWHTVVVTSTEWSNFWAQRCTEFSPLAQPEMRAAADAMFAAYEASTPKTVSNDGWHLPYITARDFDEAFELAPFSVNTSFVELVKRASVARCARVSALHHGDGGRSVEKDQDLYIKLISARPMHASPLEHVARPAKPREFTANFDGWVQLRHEVAP